MLNLLRSRKWTDASFVVRGCFFPVHSLIINANAPLLANHINTYINNVSPDVFQLLLEYIYSGRCPKDDQTINYGPRLIGAANEYKLIEMKKFVENVLVRERVLTKQNVSGYILFADAQSCPLLKEYAISFFLTHRREILKSKHSEQLRASAKLLSEILLHKDPKNYDGGSLNVNGSRLEYDKRKLDVVGSNHTLDPRVEEAKRQRAG